MIILLQSVTVLIGRLFWHISYYKVPQSNFITKCDRLLLQSASDITKCDRMLLQSASGITKCDRIYYKVRQLLQSKTWQRVKSWTLSWLKLKDYFFKKTRLFTQKCPFVLWANNCFTTNFFSYVKYFDRDSLKTDLPNYLLYHA